MRAIKQGVIERRLDRDAISDAVEKGIMDEAEAAEFRLADRAADKAIQVDDFDPEELAAKQLAGTRGDRAAE